MKARYDRKGNTLCEVCGVSPDYHGTECNGSDVVRESVRQIIARAMAQRAGAEVAASLSVEAVAQYLASNGFAIVDSDGKIVEL
jgi:hypothetical protein